MVNLRRDFIPFFRELSDKQLQHIEQISKVYSCKNGDIVYLQGEFCQNWIIVNSGSFMTRTKDEDVLIDESIILEGQSFDFESTIHNSVTTKSLEAIGESSILVIDILGLKKMAKKNPVILSLIKLQLTDSETHVWNDSILKVDKITKKLHFKIKRSFMWSVIKVVPPILALGIVLFVLTIMFKNLNNSLLSVIYLVFSLLSLLIYYLNSKLTYIELNREVAVRKEFSVLKFAKKNVSIPLDKIQSTKISYKNRIYRILKIGEITMASLEESLILEGIYNPGKSIDDINKYKFSRVNIDKAIELSSFKYLFSKKNGLFYLESQLERDENSMFSFRKSIIYFLVRGLPPFVVFTASSILLYKLFNNTNVLFMNIPSAGILLWYFIDWINDKYAFEGDKVIDIEKKPLFGKEKRIEADITSIQSIKKEQKNIFEILLNYGNIEIVTFGGKIIYPSINNPDKVIDNLYLVKKYYYSKLESQNKLERQEEFLNYTKYYQELTKT